MTLLAAASVVLGFLLLLALGLVWLVSSKEGADDQASRSWLLVLVAAGLASILLLVLVAAVLLVTGGLPS